MKRFRGKLVQNVLALYGAQAARKIIPLISLPYLARTLGPAGWGLVAFVTALAEFMVIVIDFGFNLSATREIARHRNSPERCGEVMAGVLGAQALLAAFAVVASVTAAQWIPALRSDPRLLASGLVYAVACGFSPTWFFQGLEWMRISAALELFSKLTGLGALFVFVHSPADAWKAVLVSTIPAVASMVVGLFLALRTIPWLRPTPVLVREALRMGWPMFLFRSTESLYGVGNAFLLGLFAPVQYVGYFAPAEKISKAVFGLLNPIREAVYPRLSHLAQRGQSDAASLARVSAALIIGGGVVLGGALVVFAPLLVRIFLGGEYAQVVVIVRIMAALPVLLAVTHAIGLQWLLPMGRDRAVNRVVMGAAVVNVVLSVLLAPRFLHVGMACAVVCSETFASVGMVIAVLKFSPFWKTSPPVTAAEGQA
ncbi:MAG TPA: oligosaccharide flippase family protein [Bryobacteraceae bacterium]|nr:oligosaccharide flippase family protein [Bryobacteraceae bacterium]